MRRTREYYQRLGYGEPYKWASYNDVPFSNLTKQLADCTVSIVTTAAPYQHDKGDQGPGAVYNSAAKFFDVYAATTSQMPDLRISHIAIDRDNSPADDIGAYFPLQSLQKAEQLGLIGSVGKRFYGLPTNRSTRTTLEKDCQDLLKLCQQDNIDIALLVPNCPVCHQSVSLAARTLESAGIVSVVMGCAKDIVEHVGVPRLLFSDFPLGNSAGLPHDTECQYQTIALALDLAKTATSARTTVQSPYTWKSTNPDWKLDYSNADRLSDAEIAERKRVFDENKRIAKKQ